MLNIGSRNPASTEIQLPVVKSRFKVLLQLILYKHQYMHTRVHMWVYVNDYKLSVRNE